MRWRGEGVALGTSGYVEAAEAVCVVFVGDVAGRWFGVAADLCRRSGVGDGVLGRLRVVGGRVAELYEATGDERWFVEAQSLVEEMVAKFWDEEAGGFFTTGSGDEALVARMKPMYDGATASGNSQAARALARLYALTGDGSLADRLEAMARMAGGVMLRQPTRSALFVETMAWLRTHRTVVVVGEAEDAATGLLVEAAESASDGASVVLRGIPGVESVVPQVRDKVAVGGRATAYVCRGSVCSLPVQTAEGLVALLEAEVTG